MNPSIALTIQSTTHRDTEGIRAISVAVGVFDAVELATVDELLEAYFTHGPAASGYHFLTAHTHGEVAGFACYGPRALTSGTYDLYWIVTNPTYGRSGVARALVEAVMNVLRSQAGRLLIAETSGRTEYAKTRAFYVRAGFVAEAVIPDFYSPGDDLYLFVKRA